MKYRNLRLKNIRGFTLKKQTFKHIVYSLINLPKNFWKKFKGHIWILTPLILTQFLYKIQDLVDDRYVSMLGKEALTIHNIQYNLFIIGQEIGLASATSALIFWKRKEMQGKQGSILRTHLGIPALLAFAAAIGLSFFIPYFCNHFKVPYEYSGSAKVYLSIGLFNLVLRALYVPVNAILIACDQKVKSLICIGTVFLIKFLVGWSSVHLIWDQSSNPTSVYIPMLFIGGGSIAAFLLTLTLGIRWISKIVDGWAKIEWKSILQVWPSELGIAAISAVSPIIFSFQIAKANMSDGFFVTYQLALHLTTILTLPVLAGVQIAVRDASSEQSQVEGLQFKPLHECGWWPQFFYGSLGPTLVLLAIAATFSKQIFQYVYNYDVPTDHLNFFPFFFAGWCFWQFGNIFLIMLRSCKKNRIATVNFVIAGLGVQVGVTQLLIWQNLATPVGLGLVVMAYCITFFGLNWRSISKIQHKFYRAFFLKPRKLDAEGLSEGALTSGLNATGLSSPP